MDHQEADSAVLRSIVRRRMEEECSKLALEGHARIEELIQRVCEQMQLGRQPWMTAMAAETIEEMDLEALIGAAEQELGEK